MKKGETLRNIRNKRKFRVNPAKIVKVKKKSWENKMGLLNETIRIKSGVFTLKLWVLELSLEHRSFSLA